MGFDPIRTVAGGPGVSNITSEISSIRGQSGSTGIFSRAIVHEYLGDLSRRTEEELRALSNSVFGGILALSRAPRNSLIVSPVSGPKAAQTSQKLLCYPFFPPHLAMPVKPGEQVWVIQDNFNIGFWMCRVSESNFIDDVNFTHADRKFSVYIDKTQKEAASSLVDSSNRDQTNPYDGLKERNKIPGPPGFPYGAESNTDDVAENITGLPLNDIASTVNPYDMIYTGSLAMQSVVLEPVPRFTKRPGDFVLQGSNNTLICLGQDRGWTALQRPEAAEHSNAYSDVNTSNVALQPINEFCGTIDIVSGRGKFYSQEPPNPGRLNLRDTQPRVIRNSREKLETDKNPASYTKDPQRSSIDSNRLNAPQEGDPDFLTDASRIYVSMRTNGDINFDITPDRIYSAFEGEPISVEDSPFIIMKSDEVRIIARKETTRGTVNGGIRLIKEGNLNEDMACIYMMPTGVIQLSGSKIYIGQPGEGNGPAEKKSEPYIKYSELEKLLNATYNALSNFCSKLQTHTTPGYGSPSPQITQGAVDLQNDVTSLKNQIVNLKSIRIFGE